MLASSNFTSREQSIQVRPAVERRPIQGARTELLTRLIAKATLMNRSDLDEAREISLSLGRSLDQVLLSSGFMTQAQVDACQRALFFLERELCTESLAVRGLSIACGKQIRFEDGLRYCGWGW